MEPAPVTTTISVAMCTYNGARFLPEQLRSILAQTRLPDEMVVCDDGSTDATMEVLEAFAATAPFPVRVERNEVNLQYTGNFLKAASLCHGTYVAFCDQDDVWHPDKLETVAARIEEADPVLVLHEGTVVDSQGEPTSLKIPDLSELAAAPERPPFSHGAKGFAMVVHGSVVAEVLQQWDWEAYRAVVGRHGATFGHDLLLYAWCLDRRTELVMRPLVDYRIHDSNVTATVTYMESGWRRWRSMLKAVQFADFNYGVMSAAWRAQVELLDSMYAEQPHGVRLLRDYLDERSRLWQQRADVHDRSTSRAARFRALGELGRMNRGLALAERLAPRALAKDAVLTTVHSRRR